MTRLCPTCEREITADLVELDGTDDVVKLAAAEDETDDNGYPRPTSATVGGVLRLSCSCSFHDVDVTGSVSSFEALPFEWDDDEVSES